jgi:hypothetical protein
MTTSYSSSFVFSSPTTQCWTFKFVAGQVKSKEGISNLNPDFADRWRHLVELHAAPRWLERGKRGQRSDNRISSGGQQRRQMLLTTRLSVFLIQVGQRLGLCHIDQLWLPMTDGRRPWQGRFFAPWRQPIGCRRRRSGFARGYRWTRASAQLTRDGLCVQRRYGHSRQDSGSAKKCKFAHCRSPVSALLTNAAT